MEVNITGRSVPSGAYTEQSTEIEMNLGERMGRFLTCRRPTLNTVA